MTGILKTLLTTAMAIIALGAAWASAAIAAPTFTVLPITITSTPEGTGKGSHHVFDVPGNGSITCNQITLEVGGSSSQEAQSSISFTEPKYDNCTFLGQTATVDTTGCAYVFTAAGEVTLECEEGHEITFEVAGVCQVHIPEQGPFAGITFKNIKPGTIEEITASVLVKGIKGTATGPCPVAGAFTTGEYTTGNTIVTGSIGESMVNLRWDE